MTQQEFSRAFAKSPMKRAKLRGVKRNAAVVLGNLGTQDDVALLERVRDEESDSLVRDHAAWALEQARRRAAAASDRRARWRTPSGTRRSTDRWPWVSAK